MLRAGLSALVLCITALHIPDIARAEGCRLGKVAELHVTVTPRNQILVDGSIKDQPAKFQIDTGTNVTLFDVAVFSRFGISNAGDQQRMQAIGGDVNAVRVPIPGLKIGNFVGDNLHFTVSSTHFMPDGAYALLGEDFLGSFDLDMDLANEKITLFEHNSCSSEPVYWAQNFSEAELDIQTHQTSATTTYYTGTERVFVKLELNGKPFEALVDTGFYRTAVTTQLTGRLGIDENTAGMEPSGTVRGIDGRQMPVYKYRFAELHIGDEVIKNPMLHVMKSYA